MKHYNMYNVYKMYYTIKAMIVLYILLTSHFTLHSNILYRLLIGIQDLLIKPWYNESSVCLSWFLSVSIQLLEHESITFYVEDTFTIKTIL